MTVIKKEISDTRALNSIVMFIIMKRANCSLVNVSLKTSLIPIYFRESQQNLIFV